MILYHVTTLKNALKVLRQGIKPGQPQIWCKKTMGAFEKGWIYAFDDQLDAVRWAFKTDWDLNTGRIPAMEPVVIIEFETDIDHWVRDMHIESSSYRGKWYKSKISVLPDDIRNVMMKSGWNQHVAEIVNGKYLEAGKR
jgi:hypothetical protein